MAITGARKRQPSFQVTWKSYLHWIFFVLFILLAGWLFNEFKNPVHFPIKEVKVIGAKHIDHQLLQQSLYPFVNQGFFSVDVAAVKEKISQLAWAANVSVRRVWPNEVLVTIVEKNPIAYWNQASVLSSAGDLFSPEAGTIPTNLPQFIGPEGKQILMMQYFNKINTLLQPLHFRIVRLELTSGHLWGVTLNNGMKLTVNHKDFLTRFSHFVKVYPKLVGDRANQIDYVDLRYSNGFAVKWKSVTQNV